MTEFKAGQLAKLTKAHFPSESHMEGRIGVITGGDFEGMPLIVSENTDRDSDNYIYAYADEYKLIEKEETETAAALERVKAEFEAFKKLVHKVASSEAVERDWCGEINQVMRKLGLPDVGQPPRYSVAITFTTDSGYDSIEDAKEAVFDELNDHFNRDRFDGDREFPNLSSFEVDFEEIDN